MKKQTKSNLLMSLQSLGIVFAIFFAMAFACNDGGGGETTEGNVSGLPAGIYACTTTIPIYAGQGGGGGATYPIYNYSRQTRGTIDVKSNGTYSVGGSRCHYSYEPATKSIEWQDCNFAEASSSQLTTDDKSNQLIQVKFNDDKDVWDCTKQ